MAVISITSSAGQGINMLSNLFGLFNQGGTPTAPNIGPISASIDVLNNPITDHIDLTYQNLGGGQVALNETSASKLGSVVFSATGLNLVGSANSVAGLNLPYDVVMAGNDTVDGNRYNDVILGGAGDDRLFGHSGDDSLWGGPATMSSAAAAGSTRPASKD